MSNGDTISPKGRGYWINSAIVLLFMFVIPRVVSPIAPLTEQGMHAVCIFLALLWAWCFVDFIWPSLLSMVAVGLSGFMTINEAFIDGFGDSTVIMLFFVFILAAYMTSTGLCKTLTYWFVTRKFCTGKPYVILSLLLFATFIAGATIGSMPALLIAWAITYEIIAIGGFTKGDKMPIVLIVGVVLAAVLGQCVFPFRALAAIVINSMANVAGFQMPWNVFVIVSAITCVISLSGYLLLVRFVIRPELKGLNSKEDIFAKQRAGLCYTTEQKVATVAIIIILTGALAPSFFPKEWIITQFFSKFTITSLIAVVLSLIAVYTVGIGKGFSYVASIRNGVDWSTWIMIVGSMPAAALMQSPESGVTTLINQLMLSILGDLSPFMIGLVFVLFSTLCTQVAHNVVMIIVLSPILANLALTLGFNPLPVAIFLAFGANMGLATPGASAWGAMLYAQTEWLTSKQAFIYMGSAVLITLVIMCCVGLPIANMMFQ